MIDDKKNILTLKREKNKLIFSTASFKAEQSSVLPEGVYTREFASMLSASALSVPAYILFSFFTTSAFVRVMAVIFFFVFSFLLINKYIFRDNRLEAVFDRSSKTVFIAKSGILSGSRESIPFEKISSIEIASKKYVPENVDGIRFVQKISAQHGSAMPGLGDVEEYVTLNLRLKDGTERTIFSGSVDDEPELPLNEIKRFLNI